MVSNCHDFVSVAFISHSNRDGPPNKYHENCDGVPFRMIRNFKARRKNIRVTEAVVRISL